MKGFFMRWPMISAVATTLLFLTYSKTVAASDGTNITTMTVSSSDLDLTSNIGRKLLDKRITNAAGQICGEQMIGSIEHQRCVFHITSTVRVQKNWLIARSLMTDVPRDAMSSTTD
jgi:UrcA family protein